MFDLCAVHACRVANLLYVTTARRECVILEAMTDEFVRGQKLPHSVVLQCVIENYFSIWIITLIHV